MRQALEMALEALEEATERYDIFTKKHKRAITAIKEALAQPEQAQEKTSWTLEDVKMSWKSGYKLGLEQAQKQEPVAWKNAALRVGEDLCSVGPFGYYDMTAEQWLDWALSVVTVHAPPQRKPLTNGEIYTAYITATNQTLRAQDERLAFAFARAIEAAHGIK